MSEQSRLSGLCEGWIYIYITLLWAASFWPPMIQHHPPRSSFMSSTFLSRPHIMYAYLIVEAICIVWSTGKPLSCPLFWVASVDIRFREGRIIWRLNNAEGSLNKLCPLQYTNLGFNCNSEVMVHWTYTHLRIKIIQVHVKPITLNFFPLSKR